ncbi:MAG TPA: hypothetical protein PKN31_00650 [Candidatus Atribacteria bacterium]|nr:hypothetical protein [Candidatus Atribacteria bacterium]HOA98467.1 hypothetical protein [Candidatus Atribacteria bacterium]
MMLELVDVWRNNLIFMMNMGITAENIKIRHYLLGRFLVSDCQEKNYRRRGLRW